MTQTTGELLAERYGQKPSSHKTRNSILAIVGVALLTALAGYFGFANYSPVSFNDIGYRVLSNTAVEVDFEISKPLNATVICDIQALNNSYGVVGWKQVTIGVTATKTLAMTVTLVTTETAVTGLVDSCKLQ
jgi:hypothetical protein